MYTLTMPIGQVYPTSTIDELLNCPVNTLLKELDGSISENQSVGCMYTGTLRTDIKLGEIIGGSINRQTMLIMNLIGYTNYDNSMVWVAKERSFGLFGWYSIDDYKLLLDYHINKRR